MSDCGSESGHGAGQVGLGDSGEITAPGKDRRSGGPFPGDLGQQRQDAADGDPFHAGISLLSGARMDHECGGDEEGGVQSGETAVDRDVRSGQQHKQGDQRSGEADGPDPESACVHLHHGPQDDPGQEVKEQVGKIPVGQVSGQGGHPGDQSTGISIPAEGFTRTRKDKNRDGQGFGVGASQIAAGLS